MNKKKDLSVRSIAEITGLSPATISRAMNNSTKVAPETRRKIMEILEENGQLESTVFSPHRTIGLIAASTSSDYYISLVREVIAYFDGIGDRVITFFVDEHRNCGGDAMRTMNSMPFDGIIAIDLQDLSLNKVSEVRKPVVWIDSNEQSENCCSVTSDHYVAGKLAAETLIEHGCKRTMMITGEGDSPRGILRQKGFIDAYHEHGLEYDPQLLIHTPMIHHPFAEGREAVIYNKTRGIQFDSIFAVNDWRTVGAYLAVQELGLRIPEDIKVIGYDGISIASTSLYHIPSIQQNTPLIARYASEMLMKKMRKEKVENPHVVVPVNLVNVNF